MNKLESNLILDVENILETDLDNDTKTTLMRCFELTVKSFTHKDTCNCGAERIGSTKLWCCNECGKRHEKFYPDEII